MRLVRVFLSRAWPFFFAAYLFMHLWGAARVTQLGPRYRTGLTLVLDGDHEIAWGALRVLSVCTANVCDVHAYMREGDETRMHSNLHASRGGILHFEMAAGTILTTPERLPVIAPQPPPSLWIAGWVTFLGMAFLAVQSMEILNRRDRLVRSARPCVIRDGQVEFVDGKSPRHATPTRAAPDGVGWACLRLRDGGESYRAGSGERCDVLADRDGSIASTHGDMHFVALGGVLQLVAWLPLLFIVTE